MADTVKKVQHRVTLRVYKMCEGRPMTEKQTKKWVEEHFRGCDYGTVVVTDVINEEK
jgi:hypothetical protein